MPIAIANERCDLQPVKGPKEPLSEPIPESKKEPVPENKKEPTSDAGEEPRREEIPPEKSREERIPERDTYESETEFRPKTPWFVRGGATDNNSVHDIATDSAGNVYVAGSLGKTNPTFGLRSATPQGIRAAFVAKITPAGTVAWVTSFGGNSVDTAYSLAVSFRGEVFVAGTFLGTATFGTTSLSAPNGSDAFMAMLNSSGKIQWAKRLGVGLFAEARGIAILNSNQLAAAGTFAGTLPGGAGSAPRRFHDGFVWYTDIKGQMKRLVHIKSNKLITLNGLAAKGGNLTVAGTCIGGVSVGMKTYTSKSANAREIFLLRFDLQGFLTWGTMLESTGTNELYDLELDGHNNAYVTGSFTGNVKVGTSNLKAASQTPDVLFAAIDKTGTPTWGLSARGNGTNKGYGLTWMPGGKLWLAGAVRETVSFGQKSYKDKGNGDVFVAEISITKKAWTNVAFTGSTATDRAMDIARYPTGGAVITGLFSGPIRFGGIVRKNLGSSTIFTAFLPNMSVFPTP